MSERVYFYLKRVLFPLLIGAFGGMVFHLLHFPASWLSGGVIAITAAVLAGVPTAFPSPVKNITFAGLGLIMGGGVSPETVSRMGQWPLSLLLLTLTMILITVSLVAYLKREEGRETAFFAAIPGALSYVLAIASAYGGGNQRFIALFQSLRLLILVVALPAILALTGLSVAGAVKPTISLIDAVILIVTGIITGIIFEKLKVPAGLLIGAMIMTAILYGAGLVKGEFPQAVQAVIFLMMALLIGDRFSGAKLLEIKAMLKPGLLGFTLSIIIAIAMSFLSAWLLKLPVGQVLLAFAPGGIEGMMILAFVFDLDPAYVAAHHLARFLGIALVLPFVAKLFLKR